MSDIEIKFINNSWLRFNCNRGIALEISDYFSFFMPGYRFTPKFKNKMWDGKIRLANLHNFTLPLGLIDELKSFAQRSEYSFSGHSPKTISVSPTYIKDFCASLKLTVKGESIFPYDYQLQAIKTFFEQKRSIILSPTSSGKSLIIYMILRKLEEDIDQKILLLVPTVGLVHQMINDFDDYSTNNSWIAKDNCHMIFSGQDKQSQKPIIISTWQSIYKLGTDYFKQYKTVIADEVHLAEGKSITSIMNKSVNATYRLGTTGTLKDAKSHKLQLEGLFGQAVRMVTTKELMMRNIVSDLKIKAIALEYTDDERRPRRTYKEEIDFVCAHRKRNMFIVNLTKALNGNTLILFRYISHGKELKRLIEKYTNKKIFYIDGGVKGERREEIRTEVDKEDSAVIIASYDTTATGVSINRLNSIIYASPYKSKIKVLQSIGRALRLHPSKKQAVLFDLIDDLQWRKRKNYLLKHFFDRMNHYRDEKFQFDVSRRKL